MDLLFQRNIQVKAFAEGYSRRPGRMDSSQKRGFRVGRWANRKLARRWENDSITQGRLAAD